ncbi:uncharacterized protein LOC100183462 isoform X1 [Ciona intestinalis]
MATPTAAGKKGKKKTKNTKTLSLNDFLGDTPGASPGVIKPTLDWADEADQEFRSMSTSMPYQSNSNKNKVIQLPTAPRSSRSVEIDTSRIPDTGPYTAYVGNLPYDADEFVLQEFFKDIPMTNVRLQEENGRFRGYGYVQFPDKQSLIQALQMNDETLQKRVIRVDIADNQNKEGKGRGDRYGSLSGDPDRLEGNWRRTSNDHLSGGSSRSEDNRWGGRGYEQNDRGSRFGRDRYGGGRDGRYESSFSRGGDSEQWMQRREPPKERPRLNLKPREKPLDPEASTTRSSSIFGSAKPVDTAARERMVEEKLLKQEQSLAADKPDSVAPQKKSQNIFGSAKPVDTAAREREMEQKIAEQEKQILEKAQQPKPAPPTPTRPSIFGNAKPVDTSAREREIEKKIRIQEQEMTPEPQDREVRYYPRRLSERSDEMNITSPKRRSRTSSTRSSDDHDTHVHHPPPISSEPRKPQYKPAPAPKQSAWGGKEPISVALGSNARSDARGEREEAEGNCKDDVEERTPEGAADDDVRSRATPGDGRESNSRYRPSQLSGRNQQDQFKSRQGGRGDAARHRSGEGWNSVENRRRGDGVSDNPRRRGNHGNHGNRGGANQPRPMQKNKKDEKTQKKRDPSWDSSPECDRPDGEEENDEKVPVKPSLVGKEETVDFVVESKFALLAVDSGDDDVED